MTNEPASRPLSPTGSSGKSPMRRYSIRSRSRSMPHIHESKVKLRRHGLGYCTLSSFLLFTFYLLPCGVCFTLPSADHATNHWGQSSDCCIEESRLLINWSIHWLIGWLIYWLIDWLIDWLIVNWLSKALWLTDWLSQSVKSDCLTIDQLTDQSSNFSSNYKRLAGC